MPMLAISQKPDRVSNILRSSVVTMRPRGMVRSTVAVPVVTAEQVPQAERAELHLRRLLGELGAEVTDFGLTVGADELPDTAVVAATFAANHNL